jgi:hypothetical protein
MNFTEAKIATATNIVNSISKSSRPKRLIGVELIRDGDGQTGMKPAPMANKTTA